jgi:peptidoglycan/xylan/chitin deacetylase (PgdA/CDA1 family)
MDMLLEYKTELNGFHKRIHHELTILLYHGVTRIRSKGIENNQGKHISESEFLDQMKYIRRYCNILSIDDFMEIKKNGDSLPPKSVIISFDDGFRNNYSVAAPILNDLRIPAIFYISSGIVNTDMMFWVDILEDSINLTNKKIICIDLEERKTFNIRNDEEKINALTAIKGYCKKTSSIEKDRIINQVQDVTGVVASVDHSENYQKITWKELKEMHRNSLFTIGGHSLYHNILSTLHNNLLKKEIRASLDLLEINLETQIKHYSYPEGRNNHYNQDVIGMLKELGIICSPSANCGLNAATVDPFHLKRIMVGFSGISFPFLDYTL